MTSKLGRKSHGDPPVKWNINLPTTLAAEVELLLTDPLTGIPEYGKRSKLIQELLYGWVAQRRRQHGSASTEPGVESILPKNLTPAGEDAIIKPSSPTNPGTSS